MKKILFIGHDASLTGAPILLLKFLKWIKQYDKSLRIYILLINGGELLEDFKAIGKVFIINSQTKKNILSSILIKLGYNKKKRLIKKIRNFNFEVLFFNTIATLNLLKSLKNDNKVLLYIHELEIAINVFVKNGDIKIYDHLIHRYISVSKAVKDNLINSHGIDEAKIQTIYSFPQITKANYTKSEILKELNIPKNSFIIGNVGRADLGKGIDLFLQIAISFLKINKQAVFIWVGYVPSEIKFFIEKDIETLGLKSKILLVGQQNIPANFYQLFDIFLSTSREDSFPLSVLEAASYCLPVLCYNNSGGAVEFVEDKKNGFVFPYGDIDLIVEKLNHLSKNKMEIDLLRKNACEKIKYFTEDKTFNKLYHEIKNI